MQAFRRYCCSRCIFNLLLALSLSSIYGFGCHHHHPKSAALVTCPMHNMQRVVSCLRAPRGGISHLCAQFQRQLSLLQPPWQVLPGQPHLFLLLQKPMTMLLPCMLKHSCRSMPPFSSPDRHDGQQLGMETKAGSKSKSANLRISLMEARHVLRTYDCSFVIC